MKLKNLFYIFIICILLSSFFSCDLTQDQEEVIKETTETGQTRAIFCPSTTFSGHNASGSFSCSSGTAYVGAMAGGGTLTFHTGSGLYIVIGEIKKQSNYGGGNFTTNSGSITATSSWQSFYYITSGNCSLNGSGSGMGGGVAVRSLLFYKL